MKNSNPLTWSRPAMSSATNPLLHPTFMSQQYFWEASKAFVQNTMAQWMKDNRGWCQRVMRVLLADELMQRVSWFNTLDEFSGRKLDKQNELLDFVNNKINDKEWQTMLDVLWSLNALTAVRFVKRFGMQVNVLRTRLTQLVLNSPKRVHCIGEAIPYVLDLDALKKNAVELEGLSLFVPPSLGVCLRFLRDVYFDHVIVSQYIFKSLRFHAQHDMQDIIFYLPQILQALRHDSSGLLMQFLIESAEKDNKMAHQLVWLCQTEAYEGEHKEDRPKQFFDFCDRLNNASAQINPSQYTKAAKAKMISAELIKVRKEFGLDDGSGGNGGNNDNKIKSNPNKQQHMYYYMPTNPSWKIADLLPSSVRALQSKAKVPFMAEFKIQRDHEKSEIQRCIFKTHDDCRQDALALQIISLLSKIFQDAGLNLFVFPYKVIATRTGVDKVIGGMIECVPNARSRSDLGHENDYSLRRYFIEIYGAPESQEFKKAQRNFILSVAGYAVVCYLLQIKDRHNANIMIDERGHLIHIDFGFLFDISPGKNIGFERAGFKINREMVELIGGIQSPLFRWFTELCINGYLAVRDHMDEILALVYLSAQSNLPCFTPQTLDRLKARFLPNKSTVEAAQHMKELVISSYQSWTTGGYDWFQEKSQGIWKAPKRAEDDLL
ncbi:phosphatidylinositol 4 kinase-like protein [Reticulomyxa filosa]|uniref:1-phosphatidylinositol 4-kinase n=1 Tax=Reticulomyxa filosa TaxID=46433 RepID=X6MH17_RETFI|nr:phosphatidylinositol 4 kinase-like protein [Reticulomyxa filosa]|eukprot:ETO12921.1 phosphatidylinositol 4 kinase-like protein [Reticulomyxa filosa]